MEALAAKGKVVYQMTSNDAKERLNKELGHLDRPRLGFSRFLCAACCRSGSVPPNQEDDHQADQRYEQLRLEYCVNDKDFQEKLKEL